MKQPRFALWGLVWILAVLLVLPVTMGASATDREEPASTATTSAASMAVVECSSGRLLYAKDADKRRPMASTTKICTAITVLENCVDLQKEIEVPEKAVGVEGSSVYLQKGEKVKILDLLYGLMLRSGNDCAAALAYTVGGSIEGFADLMNRTAEKAGAENTHFTNPHGLHDDAHYTTAHDLCKITAYAFRNDTFAEIVATQKHTMPWEGREYPRVLVNKNKILSTYGGGDGVKTGFTKKAGRCLVSSATRNGMRVIAAVLSCGPMFEDCAALMDKAFAEFTLCDLCDGVPLTAEADVTDGKQTTVRVGSSEHFYYPLREGERSQIKAELMPATELRAPLSAGHEAGKFTITLSNQLLFTGKLYTMDSVAALGLADKLRAFVRAW